MPIQLIYIIDFRYTVDEAIALITSDQLSDEEVEETRIAFIPPTEDPQAVTDVDSESSDLEEEADLNHLPGRILRSGCSFQVRSASGTREISTQPLSVESSKPKSSVYKRKHDRKWSTPKQDTPFNSSLPVVEPTDNQEFHVMRASINCPLDAFNIMLPKEFYNRTTNESNLYAIQQHRHLSIDDDELKVFVGICLLSGYNKVPARRMYWSEDMDVHNELVAQGMRRNRFDEIIRNLHFANNMLIDADPFYKVRPLFDIFNKQAKLVPPEINLSVDETMVEYYGRHGCKQRIQAKPIRSGFKIWNLSTSSGYVLHSEPYCGQLTQLPDLDLGHGGNVVAGLLQKANIQQGHKVHCDNYFTTFGLVEYLSGKGIGIVGTLQEKYIGNAPVPKKKIFAKRTRGEYISCKSQNVLLVCWKDNKPVTVVTNYVPIQPTKQCQRFSSVERRSIHVTMPGPLAAYNAYMGGVDVFDQMFNNYKIRVRSKKWWWPLFSYILSASAINAWRLYVSIKGPLPLIGFLRSVASQLIRTHGVAGRRGRYSLIGSVKENARQDGRDHWPCDSDVAFGVCPVCRGRTKVRCEKCDVALHVKCFKVYHVNAPM